MSEKSNHNPEDNQGPKEEKGSLFSLRGLKNRFEPIATKFRRHPMYEVAEASKEKHEKKDVDVKKGKHYNRKKRRDNLNKFKSDREKEKEAEISLEGGMESSQTENAKGEQFIRDILADMAKDLPSEQAEALKQKESELAEKAGKEKVLGKKLVSWFAKTTKAAKVVGAPLAGFAGGFAAKSALNYAAKTGTRALLDYGTMGTSIAAGMVAGGSWAGIQAYRAESKRLKDIQTYAENLKGMEALSDLEKVEKYIAINEALKQNKVQDRAEEASEFKRQLSDLSVFVKEGSWKNLEGAEKFAKILEARSSADTEDLNFENKKGLGAFDRAEAEAKKKQEKENVKQIQKQAKALLKKQGLTRNTGKIFLSTVKGAAIGAGTGFLGALAADAIFDKLGFGSKSISPEVSSAGGVVKEVKKTIPTDYSVKMEKSIWDSVKQLYLDRGVDPSKISNRLINEGMKIASEANQVEITAHHGLDHSHFDGIKDVRMEKGFELKHMEKLNDLIKEAGGKPIELEKTITITTNVPGTLPTPLPGSGGESWVNSRIEKIVDFGSRYKNTMLGVGMAGAGIAASYYALRKPKSKKEVKPEINLKPESVVKDIPQAPEEVVEDLSQTQNRAGSTVDTNARPEVLVVKDSSELEKESVWIKDFEEDVKWATEKFDNYEVVDVSKASEVDLDSFALQIDDVFSRLKKSIERMPDSLKNTKELYVSEVWDGLVNRSNVLFDKIDKRSEDLENLNNSKEKLESDQDKKLKELLTLAISELFDLEKELDKRTDPMTQQEYDEEANRFIRIHGHIKVQFDEAVVNSSDQEFIKDVGNYNQLYEHVLQKLKKLRPIKEHGVEIVAEDSTGDSHDEALAQNVSVSENVEKTKAKWEINLQKVLDIFNTEVRTGVGALFLKPYVDIEFKGALADLERIEYRLDEIEGEAKKEGQGENFKTQVEGLREEIAGLKKDLEVRIREKNEKKEKKEQAFSENLGELSEEDRKILDEAMEFGVVTKQQVEANEFGNRLNKYKLLFSVENGLVKQYFPGDFVNKSKRLKGALKAAYEGDLNKLVGFFTEYWKESEIEDNVKLKQIFKELNSHFGQPVKDAYDTASRQGKRKK